MTELTHISLFSGIGGMDLAAEWAGFKNVLFCEIDKYCQQVLKKHWPNVPIIEDIHDLKNFKQPITVISGGFPCQPFSTAGKRRGKEDDRYLWPEMFRVIREIKPSWVIGENVAGILSMGIRQVLSDMESADYRCQTFLIPACGVGALHRRDRVFVVCHTEHTGRDACEIPGSIGTRNDNGASGTYKAGELKGSDKQFGVMVDTAIEGLEGYGKSERTRQGKRPVFADAGTTNVTNANSKRFKEQQQSWQPSEGAGWQKSECNNWWCIEPSMGRVANGISRRVDRLKALGNAVVPQQVYPILKAIADIEAFLKS